MKSEFDCLYVQIWRGILLIATLQEGKPVIYRDTIATTLKFCEMYLHVIWPYLLGLFVFLNSNK